MKDPDVVCQDRLAWGLGSTGPEITSARSCGRVWTDPGTIQVDSVVQKEHVRSLSCLSLSWLGMTSCACPWCALARATLFIAAFNLWDGCLQVNPASAVRCTIEIWGVPESQTLKGSRIKWCANLCAHQRSDMYRVRHRYARGSTEGHP